MSIGRWAKLQWLRGMRQFHFIRSLVFFLYGTPFRQLIFVGTVFGLGPLLTNSYLAWAAYFDEPTAFGLTVHDCYVTATATAGATLANIIGFALFGLGTKKTLFFITLQSIAVITVFAGIYQGHGLCCGGELKDKIINLAGDEFSTSLYFSIVTWTTLGYGDFTPPQDIRLVAGLEALLGYFTFGTIVGLLTSLINEQNAIFNVRRRALWA